MSDSEDNSQLDGQALPFIEELCNNLITMSWPMEYMSQAKR